MVYFVNHATNFNETEINYDSIVSTILKDGRILTMHTETVACQADPTLCRKLSAAEKKKHYNISAFKNNIIMYNSIIVKKLNSLVKPRLSQDW